LAGLGRQVPNPTHFLAAQQAWQVFSALLVSCAGQAWLQEQQALLEVGGWL
jgi:hypothetical protein